MANTRFGVSYYGAYREEAIVSDLDQIKDIGFDVVVLAVSENDWNNFRAAVKFTADYARNIGLEVLVDLWGYAGCFGGEANSAFVENNPDVRQVTNAGDKMPMACVNSPRLRSFVKSTMTEMSADLNIDGFFIDEPYFHHDPVNSRSGCYCDDCKRFALSRNSDMYGSLSVHKNESLLSFCDEITRHVKSLNEDYLTVLCLFPDERDDAYKKQDFAKLPCLDVLATDPYWQDPAWKGFFEPGDDFVQRTAANLNAITHPQGKLSEIWIQGFSIKSGEEGKISEYMKQAADEGVDRIMVWTYKCGWGSSIACDDPKLSWSTIVDSVRKLKGIQRP